MKAYKGFNKDMTCRGKQYAENTVFEEPTAEICESGMHFCENPFDVLYHYPLIAEDGSLITIAEVEPLADVKTDNGKSVTTKLKIGSKLSFGAFVKAGIDFLLERTKKDSNNSDNGNNRAQIGSSGDWAQIGSSCNRAQIGSSGYGAQIGSSGDWAQIGSSCNRAQIGSSGDWAQIGSSGNGAQIGSSGNGARIGSSGDWAQIGSSGNRARIGSSGNGARIGSSGNRARIGSSGDWAQIGSSGDWAQIACEGQHSVVCCAGNGCVVKAKVGSWITLAEWGKIDGEYKPVCVKTEYVDGITIKEDTQYTLRDGKFVEV